jgi:hypothetical protein
VALGFGRPKQETVVSLIASKKYGRAIEVLRAQLKKRGASTTLRKQLADVLVLSGKEQEAVALLIPLADQFAREGFAAKAVSILKKIQKIDPGRRDVDERLARLIEEKQREAVVLPLSRPGAEIGMEEIGIEPPSSGPIDIPVAAAPADEGVPAAELADEGADLDLGFDTGVAIPAPADATVSPPPLEESPDAAPIPLVPVDEAPIPLAPPDEPRLGETSPDATLPLSSVPGLASAEAGGRDSSIGPGTPTAALDTQASDEIEDYDLLYVPEEHEIEEDDVVEVDLEVDADDAPEEVMSDGAFAEELMGLVDSMFQESPQGAFDLPAPPSEQSGPQRTGNQIVVSPLFRDFSVDEMVAVIAGLNLLSFERGEVILREGQPGGSLYMLTGGRVRAFRKDAGTGKQVKIADLTEGAFFGEMSILTGQPRTASIVALNSCELLELDRPTLDSITRTHPHVWDVLREFAERRSGARG